MLLNINIQESLCLKKNIYMNSFFNENENDNFSNCFNIDIHPLYGYFDIEKLYVWSYGFYLYNVFMFDTFQYNSNNEIRDINDNTLISYYIVFEQKDLSLDEETNLLYKIKNDILNLIKLFGKTKIKIYSIKKTFSSNDLYNLPIITKFHLIDILKESRLLITNVFSQIFCLAHLYNVKVVCTQKDVFDVFLSKFFYTLEDVNKLNKSRNIEKYLQYIKFFSINNPNDVNTECYVNDFFKLFNKTTKNVLFYLKNNDSSSYSSIYVHHESKHLYNTIINGIKQSKYNLSQSITRNTLICIYMSENTLSKQFLKNSNNPVIAFDNNVFIMNNITQKNLFCRYYIKTFNTKFIKQKHNTDLFHYSNIENYCENGIILCILDNSNGLFYKNQLDWFNAWKEIFDFIFKYYKNKVIVKIHKNDDYNKYIDQLKQMYTIEFINTNIDNLLDNNINFCVLNYGSTYIKCVQKGILVKSNRYDNTKGIYDLKDLDIFSQLDKFIKNRFEIFKNLLNQIVSLEDIKNGNFFNNIYNNFPEDT